MNKLKSAKLTMALAGVILFVGGMTGCSGGGGKGGTTTSTTATTSSGGSGSGGVTDTKPPVITSLDAKSPVQPGEKVDLKCNVSGGDGALNYSWTTDCGTISGAGPTGLWMAPEKEGECKLSVLVKDAKNSPVSADKMIQVVKVVPPVVIGGTTSVLEVQSVNVMEGSNLWPSWAGTVSADISSSAGVETVKVDVLQNGTVMKTVDMAPSGGNFYKALVSIQSASLSQQSYVIRVVALDKTGKMAQKEAPSSISIAFPTLPTLPES